MITRDSNQHGVIKMNDEKSLIFRSYAAGTRYQRFYDDGYITFNTDDSTNSSIKYDVRVSGTFYATEVAADTISSFTGFHHALIQMGLLDIEEGMLLDVTGEVDTTNIVNVLPHVVPCSREKSNAVYGILMKIYGAFDGENYKIGVVGLGEGMMWVTNLNGDLNVGDYICSSNISGYGMKQIDITMKNYTVAKCIQQLDWDDVTSIIRYNGIDYKRALIAVTFHCS